MKRIGFGVLLVGICLQAEPSVYAIGQSGYRNSNKEIALLRQKVNRLEEQIEGLRSVIEGLSSKRYAPSSETSGVSSAQIEALKARVSAIEKQLGSQKHKPSSSYSGTKRESKGDTAWQNQKLKSIYTQGVRLFSKKRYDEAKKRFEHTDAKGYKSAASNYYLGEIAYYTKRYEDAIFHYKKSAGLNENASYIDVLLLHAGISLEKTGQKAQAKRFFENIIANYPGRKSAKIAQKHLKGL